MPEGTVVATDVVFSSFDKGRGVPADTREVFLADDGVMLADG